jgi:hypothetical protein
MIKVACPKCHWADKTEVEIMMDKDGMAMIIYCKNKNCMSNHHAQISFTKFGELVPVTDKMEKQS